MTMSRKVYPYSLDRKDAKVAGVAPGSVGTLLARAARRFVAAWDHGENDGEQALG